LKTNWKFRFISQKYYEISGKNFLLAHGDGLGPGDKGYKRMKKLFTNPVAQWFSMVTP
jgi:UDP-2,3-diacylglucosamine hydrolase